MVIQYIIAARLHISIWVNKIPYNKRIDNISRMSNNISWKMQWLFIEIYYIYILLSLILAIKNWNKNYEIVFQYYFENLICDHCSRINMNFRNIAKQNKIKQQILGKLGFYHNYFFTLYFIKRLFLIPKINPYNISNILLWVPNRYLNLNLNYWIKSYLGTL